MVLGDLLNGKPAQSKPLVYILGLIIVACTIAFSILDFSGDFTYISLYVEDILLAIAFIFIGVSIARGKSGAVLGGVALLIGHYALNAGSDMGFYFDFITWDIEDAEINYLIYDIIYGVNAVLFFIGSITFVLAKFCGINKQTNIKVTTVCYILSTILLLILCVLDIYTYDDYLSEYIAYFIYNIGDALVPMYLLFASTFSETIVYPSAKISE